MFTVLASLLLSAMAGASDPVPPPPSLAAGRLTENIESSRFPGHRFAIYLPTGVVPDRPTPVLYLLDPRGRARVPVRVYQAAAERFETPAALEARRRLNQLEVQLGFYLPADALARSALARADFYLSLAMRIDDASPVSWYLRAQWHARRKDALGALDALRRAVAAGFRDVALLDGDRSFAAIRARSDYAAFVADLRALGDRLDVLTVDRPPIHVRR
jgi:hypothetical protein